MLGIGRQTACAGHGWTRREMLRAGALSAAGITLADLLRAQASASTEAPAKSIILLWLWGGPSHLDTFDMKPKAPVQYRGPYAPIATQTPGIQICELLPLLAKQSNRYAILRSLHCSSNDHGIAGTIGLTGSESGGASLGGQVQPGAVKPAHGAVVSKALGFDPAMPRFVSIGGRLHQGKKPITGEGGGGLGGLFDPFRLDYDPLEGVKLPQLDLLEGQSVEGLLGRQSLRESLDGVARSLDRWPQMERFDQFRQQAFSLLTSPAARAVFDLERELSDLRARYGRFRFGQCCLMARRLIEAGVRFVQVNWSSHV